jgi:hypothetical protein
MKTGFRPTGKSCLSHADYCARLGYSKKNPLED